MGVPKLRFKADDGSDFPDWTYRTFGSVVEEFNDRTTTENEDVLLSCAIDGMYLNSELFGHQRGASNIGYKKITKGALILSMQNLHLGNANVNTRFEHGIVSPAYKTFHIVGCLTEFMSAWVKRHAARIFFYDATTVGASQCRRNVDWEELYQQTIAVPSPLEQCKIADLLSAVDDVIAAQEAEVAAWEKRKKGVMQKLFRQEVRFKADDGSDFPDWEEKTLGDICMYERQRSEGANFIGTENMLKDFGGVAFDNSKADGSGTLYHPGDTLMSNIRPYLKKAWLADRKGTCSTDVLVFHPTSVEPGYLYWLIASDAFVRYVMSAAKGSKMPRGDKKHIMEMPLLLPNKDEQRKIDDCLSSLNDVIIKAKNELAKWQELKKGLLQQMFV